MACLGSGGGARDHAVPPNFHALKVNVIALSLSLQYNTEPMGVSRSHDEPGDRRPLNLEELQVENQLLERYLNQKNVDLPITLNIPNHRKDECSTPIDFKLQIAIETLSQLNNTLETRRNAANKLISTVKVMINETELRIADIQREAHDFQKDVVDGGKCTNNPERYRAEKFVRYMDLKLCDQESALDKIRLKNSTLYG